MYWNSLFAVIISCSRREHHGPFRVIIHRLDLYADDPDSQYYMGPAHAAGLRSVRGKQGAAGFWALRPSPLYDNRTVFQRYEPPWSGTVAELACCLRSAHGLVWGVLAPLFSRRLYTARFLSPLPWRAGTGSGVTGGGFFAAGDLWPVDLACCRFRYSRHRAYWDSLAASTNNPAGILSVIYFLFFIYFYIRENLSCNRLCKKWNGNLSQAERNELKALVKILGSELRKKG